MGAINYILISLGLAVICLSPIPAVASDPGQVTITTADLVEDVELEVTTYTTGGDVISTQHLKPTTSELATPAPTAPSGVGVSPLASESGGGGSNEGCRTIRAAVTYKTLLGFKAFTFKSHLYWCWKNTKTIKKVKNVSHGYDFDVHDGVYRWREIAQEDHRHYDWGAENGFPKSAYRSMYKGRFENCVVKYGCISELYPRTNIHAYADGSWWWGTKV